MNWEQLETIGNNWEQFHIIARITKNYQELQQELLEFFKFLHSNVRIATICKNYQELQQELARIDIAPAEHASSKKNRRRFYFLVQEAAKNLFHPHLRQN